MTFVCLMILSPKGVQVEGVFMVGLLIQFCWFVCFFNGCLLGLINWKIIGYYSDEIV